MLYDQSYFLANVRFPIRIIFFMGTCSPRDKTLNRKASVDSSASNNTASIKENDDPSFSCFSRGSRPTQENNKNSIRSTVIRKPSLEMNPEVFDRW